MFLGQAEPGYAAPVASVPTAWRMLDEIASGGLWAASRDR
jgi:hypothetical protein